MNRISRVEYSIRNVVASMIGYTLNIILSFICRIFFVQFLGAEYLGISSMFSNILSLLTLSELGIGTAMIYALYKPISNNDEKKIASYMKIYGTAYKFVGIIIFILGLLIVPFLSVIVNTNVTIKENIYILYILFLISTATSYFFSYRSSILIAHQRNYIVIAISYAIVIIQDIVQIVTLFLTKNYLFYLVEQIFFVFLTNVLISRKASLDYPYIKEKKVESLSSEEKKSLLKNIKAITITKLSGILVNNTDNLVITYFNGLISTGIVSNYIMLVSTLNSLVNQLFTSISGSLGSLNAESESEHRFLVFESLNLLNFWVYGFASIVIITLSSDLVLFFFGSEYVLNLEIPIILAINFYMAGMQCVVGMYKSTMGLFRYGQYVLLITAILNIIGDFILGSKLGIFGIFLATAISRILTNTWYEPYVVFHFGFKKNIIRYAVQYLQYAFILIIATIICYIICELYHFNLIINIFLKTLTCFIFSNLLFFACFFKTEKFRFITKKIYEMLMKKKHSK